MGTTTGRGKQSNSNKPNRSDQRDPRAAADTAFPRVAEPVAMKTARRRIDVNLEELDRIIDRGATRRR